MRTSEQEIRGESKSERPGTPLLLEFLVGWYYDADATMAVPERY